MKGFKDFLKEESIKLANGKDINLRIGQTVTLTYKTRQGSKTGRARILHFPLRPNTVKFEIEGEMGQFTFPGDLILDIK